MKRKLLIIVATFFVTLFSVNSYAFEIEADIHGFISLGYLKTSKYNFFGDTMDGTSQFKEMGINISSDLTDNLRVGGQLFSRDFGYYGNNEVDIDWAFGDYNIAEWLGVRAGKIKIPQGFYNESRDIDMLRTSILLPQSVYAEILRDVNMSLEGVGLYGSIDMSFAGNLNYQILKGTQALEGDLTSKTLYMMGISGNDQYNGIVTDDIDVDTKKVLALVWDTPVEGLRIGYTYDRTEVAINSSMKFGAFDVVVDIDITKLENTVFSLEYTIDDLQLFGEYKKSVNTFDLSATIPAFGLDMGSTSAKTETIGWYVGASYRVNDLLEVGLYYSETIGEKNSLAVIIDPVHRTYVKDVCVSTKINFTDSIAVKLEGHLFEGTEFLNVSDQDSENTWEDKDWAMFACKFTYSF